MNVRQRAINMRNCLSMMASMYSVSAAQNRIIAGEFFKEMQASPFTSINAAVGVLDLLGVKPITEVNTSNADYEVLAPLPAPTRDMFNEALSKNAKGFVAPPSASSSSSTSAPTYQETISPQAESSVRGSDSYPTRVVHNARNDAPVVTPPAPAPASAPVAAPAATATAPAPTPSRGTIPGLLGRRPAQPAAAPAPVSPPAPVPAPVQAAPVYHSSSTMQEESEEVYQGRTVSPVPAAPVAKIPSPEPEPPKPPPAPVAAPAPVPKPPSAKTRSLLDDLMGGADTSSTGGSKKASDSLWD